MTPGKEITQSNAARDWWQEFFESPDCVPLSFFPSARETDREVTGLQQILGLNTAMRIADLCCGAGRHALRLAERGYRVWGLDASALLLARAQEKAAQQGLQIPLIRGDARHLPFADGAFEVVLNLFNSFGYCESDADNEMVLQEAVRCLAPGGQFLLETRHAQHLILFAPLRQEVQTVEGDTLIMSCRYDRQRHRLETTWHTTQRPKRQVYRASIRLYQLEELRALATKAGLEEIGVYSGYEGRQFTGYERVLIYHGRKR